MSLQFLIFVGSFIGGLVCGVFKNRIFSHLVNILSSLLIFIIFPVFIFFMILQMETVAGFLNMVFSAIFVVVGLLPGAYLFSRRYRLRKETLLPMVFMNSGYLGIPLSYSFYLDEGLRLAVIYNLTIGVLLLSLGMLLIGGTPLQLLKYPSIYATFLALIIRSVNIPIIPIFSFNPTWIMKLGIPCMMFVLGYWLVDTLPQKFLKPGFFGALLRILGGFILGYIYISLFNITNNVQQGTILLLSSAPASILSFILLKKYHKPSDFTSAHLIISSIIYILLILIIYLYKIAFS